MDGIDYESLPVEILNVVVLLKLDRGSMPQHVAETIIMDCEADFRKKMEKERKKKRNRKPTRRKMLFSQNFNLFSASS